MPRDQSLWHPPSHCPDCGARLRFADLVPLISFLWQRRRCRYCGGRISSRYFWVELVTALLFAAVGWSFRISLDSALLAVWIGLLVATFVIDLEHFIIPDELNLAGVLIGVARDLVKLNSAAHQATWGLASIPLPSGIELHLPRSIAGALCFMAVVYAIRLLGTLLFRKEAMGLGDVKLAAAMGANLTAGQLVIAGFSSVLVGSVVGVALLATGRLQGGEGEGAGLPGGAEADHPEGDVALPRPLEPEGQAGEPARRTGVGFPVALPAEETGVELKPPDSSPNHESVVGDAASAEAETPAAASPESEEDDWEVPAGALPFGPFLVLGVLIAIFWGEALFTAYLRSVGFEP